MSTTPQTKAPKLAEKIGLKNGLYLKREDLQPYNSHKGRSIPLMIKYYLDRGCNDFVISSSGNAALAAIRTIVQHNQTHEVSPASLRVYVGLGIDKNKYNLITKYAADDKNIIIKKITNPKQSAFLISKSESTVNLRQSTDDIALQGYETMASELAEIDGISAVFVPTSSGTLAQGLFQGFKKLNLKPQIHIVQTESCHPFVSSNAIENSLPSLATAIVDRIGYRAKQIKQLIIENKGAAWIARNDEILNAQNLVRQCEGVDISPNSALSIVGLKKAVENGFDFAGPVVCLITGP